MTKSIRIIIPIKQVPETRQVRIDERSGTVVRQGVTSIVNPLDLYALELALQLRARGGVETVALSMGPPGAERALREALAMGIDRAVLVSDPAYAGSDTWATAFILAAAVRRLGGADLILCGERATDGDTGQVGPELAAALGMPAVTYVNRFELEGESFRAGRGVEDGVEELSGTLPVLLSVLKEIGEPRLPTLDGKMRARRAATPVWGQTELQLDPVLVGLNGSPTRVMKIYRPTVARRGRLVFAGDDAKTAAAVDELMDWLSARGEK